MNSIENRIFELIRSPYLAGLATTTEEGKPWVRYVIAIGDQDLTIRFSTFINSRKVSQIRKNTEVHMICGGTANSLADFSPYLQIQETASISDSRDEKDGFWNPSLERIFTGPDDPNYVVVVVKPSLIEYTVSGKSKPPELWIKNEKQKASNDNVNRF